MLGVSYPGNLPATRLALGALVEAAVSGQAAAQQNWPGAMSGPLPWVGHGGSSAETWCGHDSEMAPTLHHTSHPLLWAM